MKTHQICCSYNKFEFDVSSKDIKVVDTPQMHSLCKNYWAGIAMFTRQYSWPFTVDFDRDNLHVDGFQLS